MRPASQGPLKPSRRRTSAFDDVKASWQHVIINCLWGLAPNASGPIRTHHALDAHVKLQDITIDIVAMALQLELVVLLRLAASTCKYTSWRELHIRLGKLSHHFRK